MDAPAHCDNVSFLVVDHIIETDDQMIEITSTDPCQSPDHTCTRMRISDLLATPPERLDHGQKEKERESVNLPTSPSLPYSSGMNPREKSKRLGVGFGMWSPSLSNMLSGNYLGGVRSGRSKLRTPRTLTRLMQQHRDSERHRHRGLNATIKEISRKIPGYEDASNETKIVKLQRIINYICHVEQHIMFLCEEQGLDFEYKNLFLLPHLPKVTDLRKTNSRSSPGGRVVSSAVGTRTYKSSREIGVNKYIEDDFEGEMAGEAVDPLSRAQDGGDDDARPLWIQNLFHNSDDSGDTPVSSGRAVTHRSRCRRRVKPSSPAVDTSKDHLTSSSAQSLHQGNSDIRNAVWSAKEEPLTLTEDMAGDSVTMETETTGCSDDVGAVVTSSESLPSVLHVTLLKEPENCDVHWLDYAASVDMQDIVEYRSRGVGEGTEGEGATKDVCQLPSDILKCEEEETVLPTLEFTNDVITFHSYAKTPPTPVALTDLLKRENKERGHSPEKCGSHMTVAQQTVACSSATSQHATALRPPLCTLSNTTDNSQGNAPAHWQFYQATDAPPGGEGSMLRNDPLLPSNGYPKRRLDETACQTTSTPTVSTGRAGVENVEPSGTTASRSGRIDHRKTSWMNGFMMYSQLHRKLYIEENPGVHTSHISKLMGHDWRQLNPTQQQPYRDKAKLYIKQYLSPNVSTS